MVWRDHGSETTVNVAEPPAHRQEQKEAFPSLLSCEHLLGSVSDNIISPLWFLSPEGSVTVSEAAGERQPRAPGYSLRQSQWSHQLDAAFKPCLQKLLALGEPELFHTAAASSSPVNHLPPPLACEHLQPVIAQDRIQGLLSLFQFFPSDHKNRVFPFSQAEEAARGGQGGHPQPVCVQMVVLKGNTWSLALLGRPICLARTRVQGLRAFPPAAPSPQ